MRKKKLCLIKEGEKEVTVCYGKPEQELRTGKETDAMEKHCLMARSLRLAQPAFLLIPQSHI